MEFRVKQREHELEKLKDKKERYGNREAKDYRERLQFALYRLLKLDWTDKNEFLTETKVVSKFFAGVFAFILVSILCLKYLGVIGWVGALFLGSVLAWASAENELKLND